jgi:hypothetical protein
MPEERATARECNDASVVRGSGLSEGAEAHIAATSYTAVAVADTMTSHAGWLEAGGTNAPTYTGNRKTAVWAAAAAGAKALSPALSFAITSTGTIKGAFLCYGSGALNTKDNTAGVLWSAGTFSTGDKAVVNGDTLNVNFSTSL